MNMTPGVASIVVFLASTGCGTAPGPAAEESKTVNTEKQEAQEPTGKIAELKEFVGTWKINQALKTADGREVMSNGFANTRFVLGGRFMEYSIKTDPGGNESYGIIMFDKKKEKYRSWFFNSDGRHNEWSGTWDKATRTLTRTADFGNGNTGTATGRFLDDGTQQFSLIGTHRDGKVFVDLKSTLKRQPEAIRVVRRRSKARATTPVELAPLEKLIGKWDDESVSKVAEWTPEEVRLKFESDHFWMLGGKFVFHESKGAIFLTTYSAQAKVFKMWHFNAGGYVHEWTGEWNADTNTLTLRSDLDGHLTVSSLLTQTFSGDGTSSWSARATDKTGKVFHHLEGESKRQK